MKLNWINLKNQNNNFDITYKNKCKYVRSDKHISNKEVHLVVSVVFWSHEEGDRRGYPRGRKNVQRHNLKL